MTTLHATTGVVTSTAQLVSEPPATVPATAVVVAAVPSTTQADPLAEIDDVVGEWTDRQQAFVQRQADARAARLQFEHDAEVLAHTVVRPALDAVVARLRADGGDGRVDERPRDDRHPYRLTLWMSLEGTIAEPRQDRNPYLQLDLDLANRRFNVWEGDMWEKQGSSRDSTPWRLDEITTEAVTDRVIAILERAASHDVIA